MHQRIGGFVQDDIKPAFGQALGKS